MRPHATWLESLLAARAAAVRAEHAVRRRLRLGHAAAVGSEPALFGLLQLNPDLFWSAICVATAGNTLGGMLDWWMGYGRTRSSTSTALEQRTEGARLPGALGPKACLLAWLPIVGDPLCAVAGWLRLPFWPCTGYMLVGKFLRYLVMTTALLWMFPH
jgi:membrane protein YqaA with SNARE-associated domain